MTEEAQCKWGTVCENVLGGYQCVTKKTKNCTNGYFENLGKCIGKKERYHSSVHTQKL